MKHTRASTIVLALSLSLVANLSLYSVEAPVTSPTALSGPAAKGNDPEIIGEEKAVLTHAPNVPPPIQRKHATKVIVNIEVREVVKRLADGVDYLFWTSKRVAEDAVFIAALADAAL
jgi:nitrite reductase (NO-forming)